jgi:hypothetical protein
MKAATYKTVLRPSQQVHIGKDVPIFYVLFLSGKSSECEQYAEDSIT